MFMVIASLQRKLYFQYFPIISFTLSYMMKIVVARKHDLLLSVDFRFSSFSSSPHSVPSCCSSVGRDFLEAAKQFHRLQNFNFSGDRLSF
jgi:hypothetical protein